METATTVCPSCDAENNASARFCSTCGARLADAAPPREERKLVSVLFVDLVGFTARSDRADPEDVRESLVLYHAEARRTIEHHGGVLEKFIGDAVMAVFGAPVAHGDDAERAVRAGLRVLEGIGELNRDHALGLAARAAVNTGEAVVSLDAGHGDALATGDVVNTASRLQSAAPEGRLLVAGETYRATRSAIRYEPFEPVTAKGKSEALDAWLAVEPLAAPAERLLSGTPLVGRTRELELMESVWRRALADQRPHLVTVLGPLGIGKSRLCREFSARVHADGGRILRGRCLPYEEQVGYQAFSRLVHGMAGILESDEPELARDKLRAAVDRLMPEPERAETFRYLALLLGLSRGDNVPQPSLLFYAARRFLECVGLAEPSVVVFEDIHWAQGSEIALLEYLARHLRDAPVLLVATARPELLDQQPAWGAGVTALSTIALDPLTAADAEALAGRLVDGAGGSLDVGRLVDAAGGNPLFIEELAASLAEVDESDGLPVTVREAIAARIDALPPGARAVLLAASVVGRTFWSGVLGSVAGADDVAEALAVLEERDLVRRDASSQLSGDVQFTFKHMLIREVAYSTLPRAVRRERHAAVARHVEETLSGAAETLPTILAHHWREAGEPARAIPYLLSAADAARRSWAQEAVVDLYALALELAGDDAEQRRRIRLQRGFALVELADYPAAADELSELLPELEGAERFEALIALGHTYVWTERENETLETVAQAHELVGEVEDETAEAAVLALESQGLAMRGHEGDLERSWELGERSLELWVPGTRSLDLRHQLHLHANTACWIGEYERSLELSRETRALATDVHSAESLLRGGGHEALTLANLGRHEEAIAIWDELLALAAELGHNRRVLLNYSTIAYRELYDLDEARRRSEEALELSGAEAFGMPRQFAGSDLIFTQLLEGDVGGAQSAWPERWEAASQATGWTTWLITARLAVARAEIALQADGPETAVEWAQRALEVTRRTKRRKYEARALTLLGQGLARLGRRDEALAAFRSAAELADALGNPPGRWQAHAALGAVAGSLGADDTASEAYAEAARVVESFAPTLAPERSARLLAAEPVAAILSAAGARASEVGAGGFEPP